VTPPGEILEIVRKSLDRGQAVEIEGLGTFERTPAGGYDFRQQSQPEVFVAYVEEDLAAALRLAAGLRAAGCSPWLDKEKLLPGQNWPRAIDRAIEISDAFIACFSPCSISKRSQFQNELRYALDCARRMPLDSLFFIPVRLERCALPRRIASETQYVDLFPDWERGLRRIVRSLDQVKRRTPLAGLSSV
jgi:hypothetical protein